MQADTSSQLYKEKSFTGKIKMDQLPGPARLPLLGNLLQLSPKKFHRIVEKWSDKYGPIFRIKLGTTPVVVITSPEAFQYVLRNRPEKFRRLGKMDDIMRELGVFGVFNAEGDDWKRQRKLVSQALNLNHLKTFYPSLDDITKKLLSRWAELADTDTSIEIKGEITRYTVDNTSKLAFGYSMNTIEKKKDIIQDHLEIMFPAIFKRINAPIPYWRFLKMPADRKLDQSLKVVNKTLQEIVEKTREELAQNTALSNHPTNFLQALLAASDRDQTVSGQVIIGNVLTMLLAGEDTTAHTIAWIFYFMHLYPEVQLKMQQEADQVLENESTLKSYEDASKLHYIEAVVLEAMRLKPVAPVLFHDTLEDVVIEGVEVPRGTSILLQTNYAAIKENYFSYPEKFIPERWMLGGCPAHNAHNESAFAPFGAGPRFCPGYNLAILEMKAVLSMVCKNFTITMETDPKDVKEILAFVMMPSGFFIKLVRRK